MKRDTNVHKLGPKLGVDPMELLRMINGRAVPTKAAIAGLARVLDSDVLPDQAGSVEIKQE